MHGNLHLGRELANGFGLRCANMEEGNKKNSLTITLAMTAGEKNLLKNYKLVLTCFETIIVNVLHNCYELK